MRTIYVFFALFFVSISFGQVGQLDGKVTDNDLGFPGLKLELLQDGTSILQTQTDFDGNYGFTNVPFGIYTLRIGCTGVRPETTDNIIIEKETSTYHFVYPKPCIEIGRVCPKGHKNNIIPILYGLPSSKTMKQADKGKVKLGGCTPYCEKWHCKVHDLDF